MKKQLFVLAWVLSACGSETAQSVLEARRADMTAYLEPVRAKVTGDRPVLTADGVTGVQGPLITWFDTQGRGNAVVLTETEIEQLRKDGTDNSFVKPRTHDGKEIERFNMYGTLDFEQLAEWVVGKKVRFPLDITTPDDARKTIVRFFGLQYVIVIRILDFTAPAYAKGSTETAPRFTSGLVHAEARVLDVQGTDHGGFRFAASSSDTIRTSTNDRDDSLTADLEANAATAFDQAMQKAVPGSSGFEHFVTASPLGSASR